MTTVLARKTAWPTCRAPGGFSLGVGHVAHDAFSSAIQTRTKWHHPGWKEPCVFFYHRASKHISPPSSLYGNFAHTDVKQQLLGRGFEQQLAISAALMLELGFPLHAEKRIPFLLHYLEMFLPISFVNASHGNSQALSGVNVFEVSPK